MLKIRTSKKSSKSHRFFYAFFLMISMMIFINCGGGGGGGTTDSPAVSVPTLTSLDPVSGPVGTVVTLTGTNLTGATSISFNGTDATSFTVVSATHITATVPSGATTGTIAVTTPGGTATSSASFTVTASLPPTLTSFNPSSGPVGHTVTLTGTNLIGATSVSFNGTNATSFTVVNTTQITATVPSGATSGTIVVTTPGGTATSSESFTVNSSTQIIADHTCTGAVPDDAITMAKANLHIAYGHTSHGTQLITGMNALAIWNSSLYSWNNGGTGGALDLRDEAMGGDVGYYPAWVDNTRSYLGTPNSSTGRGTTNPDVNVIIWSWCGQASGYTEQDMIDKYLSPMTQLEADYPGIKFVYMTGHLEGTGEDGAINVRNQQIRDYCTANNKILFDFADIESYDPDGATNYMPLLANDNCDYDSNDDGTQESNWATNWVGANPGTLLTTLAGSCSSCAHSQGLNCALKGRAVWWLWARLAGWNP